MLYSPESLIAFVESAALGSFSAAARKLNKSQSSISAAIANLEIDLGLVLFDRTSRYPLLTEEGRKVLWYAQTILTASSDLEELSIRLQDNIEPRLSLVVSDIYQLNPDHKLMKMFEQRYPDIELEILDAEDVYVLDLLGRGRAQIGLLGALSSYPEDIAVRHLHVQAEMAIFVGRNHPLTEQMDVTHAHLQHYRQIRLTNLGSIDRHENPRVWSASDYLVVLEMAEAGFGWAELPRSLLKQYGRGRLSEIRLLGFPKKISIDAIWSVRNPPGVAGFWLIDQLLKPSVKV